VLAGAHWFAARAGSAPLIAARRKAHLPHGGRDIVRCFGRREDQGALANEVGF
jgi:hypothetical protein